jgi:hypothetical protein
MVQFAPISTSSPITTVPHCGTFSQPSAVGSKPNPSEPITLPAWITLRRPSSTPPYRTTPG